MITTLKTWVKQNFAGLIYGSKKKPARKIKLLENIRAFEMKPPARLSDLSFDIFTYHGEDGIIAYLIHLLKDVPPVFVDAGAGNCIVGNCSTLAFHFGWKGIFIDEDIKQIETGKRFYRHQMRDGEGINFIANIITPQNINSLISSTGIEGDIGLLSIDIDGNDYWIWKAVDIVRPRIVVVEAKVEFGEGSWIVPYGKKNSRTIDRSYNGASVEAFRKLGEKKGYKLVGANKQGYNLFFVQEHEAIPSITTKDVLGSPSTTRSFYSVEFFKQHKFVKE
jgi:hypothetical protein